MKKTILLSLALLVCGSAFAQENSPAKFKLYGFIRNYLAVDTRNVNGGTYDLYYYMPKDIVMGEGGQDLNEGFNWKYTALTTRLGLDMSGYQFGSMNVSGKVEADFYSLNGTSTSSTIAQFRLRQAYMALKWNLAENESLTVNLVQTWHPMGVDLPNCINLESGAPFGPFNRSPQVMLHWKIGGFTMAGGFLYLSQYLPVDFQESMNAGKTTKGSDPFKYGLPEIYYGVAYGTGPVVAKLGLNCLITKPIRTFDGTKANGLMVAPSLFAYFQYTQGLLQVKAKSSLLQSSEHLNVLSGYGVSSYDPDTHTFTYTPMRDWASWISFQYGKKFQVMAMAGYMKQLGTTADLDPDFGLYLNSAAATNIQQAVRVTPTLAWNIGKFTVALEYDLTAAEFGNTEASGFESASRNLRGLYEAGQTHWVMNHRFLCMTKFNF